MTRNITHEEFAELVASTKVNTDNIAEILKILRGNGHEGMVIIVDRLSQNLIQLQTQMQILTGRVQKLEDARTTDEQKFAVSSVNATDWQNRLDEITREVKTLQGADIQHKLIVEVIKGVILPIAFMVIGQLLYIFGNLIVSNLHH
jgi:hypothetical protein